MGEKLNKIQKRSSENSDVLLNIFAKVNKSERKISF